jgi:hypothetical protein
VKEVRIGTVVNYFSRPMTAAVLVENTSLEKGDAIHIRGNITDLYHRIDSLEIDRAPAESAAAGETAGIKLNAPVRRRDAVFRLEE